jgi:hypothetical protein
MLQSLPALKDLNLYLNNEAFPRRLLLPWFQLRTCVASDVHSFEFLWMASQLPPGSEITALKGANIDRWRSAPPKMSSIRSLTLTDCGEVFTTEVLEFLVAHALEVLVIENNSTSGADLTQRLLTFLDKCAGRLKHLRIHTDITEDDLIHIFNSPHTRNIVHLDVSSTVISNRGLAALASHLHLRTLILRGDPDLQLTTLTNHRPFIGSHHNTLSRTGGLEVILI